METSIVLVLASFNRVKRMNVFYHNYAKLMVFYTADNQLCIEIFGKAGPYYIGFCTKQPKE